MTDHQSAASRQPLTPDEDATFHATMESLSVTALWEREARSNQPPEPAHIWHWRDIEPLIDVAVRATNMDNAERRVLVLNNPAFADSHRYGANTNLTANFQVLMPGERARPHRHSMSALRFVVEGSGACTIVDGKPCPMERGDFILTPGWTWHEHVHEGSERVVWLDGLDVPLHNHFDTGEFEPGPARDVPALAPDDAFSAAGLTPWGDAAETPYSPMFRYPWRDAVRALKAMPPAADGSRKLRYTNPRTGGAAMATLDCYLLAPAEGVGTTPYRSTSNGVCLVVEGEGESRIGEETIAWGRNDLFTLPHWQWISHRAASADARLFLMTDREVQARIGILREEVQD